MVAPVEVQALVDKFAADSERFRNPKYNETQVRIEFIDPFFKALGWDVSNSLQVVHEDRVLVSEGQQKKIKHPDYGFKIGRDLKFYVEAKKPAVDLQHNPDPAYQVRRYGWSKGLKVSVLTDFEEFIIYDCVSQPDRKDKAHIARVSYIPYTDYVERWDEIYDLLSFEAVQAGAIETFAQEALPKGTVTVDEAFLREMEAWRMMLAKDIALHNPKLTRRELNIAVQRTIDRIVFLRICEDRNIEPYSRLYNNASERNQVYDNLKRIYAEAHDKYNSGLFDFGHEGDQVSLDIHVSDAPLQDIIKRLYYPNSPYEFSVLPSDILGQVYERFLGKVIELNAAGQADIVEKPEVRKAGGVYYTPTYIVDYIVENTVGKLVEGKTPNAVANLRVLDPACGSGSFLIGAYQYLVDWHVDYYSTKALTTALRDKKLRETNDSSNPYALTTDEKKRILLNNIYGVDLDQQAVEVTKLSLLLKMLEDETDTTARQYTLFATDERILPDLGDNIKWGNSLIGSDFYSGKQLGMFDDEEIYRVKAFDWDTEFEAIMRDGGFDAVIGNPPYIRIQVMKETAPETVPYYKSKYISGKKGNYDIYVVFVERGLRLLANKGLLGFILPHKFFNANYGQNLRHLIASNRYLSQIVYFDDIQIFSGATTYTCLLFLANDKQDKFSYTNVKNLNNWVVNSNAETAMIPADDALSEEWNFLVGKQRKIYNKLKKMQNTLGDIAHTFVGTQTSADTVFVLEDCVVEGEFVTAFSKELGKQVKVEKSILEPFLRGKQIRRYLTPNTNSMLLSPYHISETDARLFSLKEMEENYPLALKYLQENRTKLESREGGKFQTNEWYAFGYPKSMHLFQKNKIIVPDYNDTAAFTIDYDNHFYKTGYGVLLDNNLYSPLYIMGLLNSKLLFSYLMIISTTLRGGYVRFWTKYIEPLPICTIDFDNPDEKAQHDTMVQLVETMLDLHKQLGEESGQAKKVIEQQIKRTDKAIDTLVYQLYGLTDEEIRIVEG